MGFQNGWKKTLYHICAIFAFDSMQCKLLHNVFVQTKKKICIKKRFHIFEGWMKGKEMTAAEISDFWLVDIVQDKKLP